MEAICSNQLRQKFIGFQDDKESILFALIKMKKLVRLSSLSMKDLTMDFTLYIICYDLLLILTHDQILFLSAEEGRLVEKRNRKKA